ncbi:hypothetical protein GXW74_27225 [Roseomonas eburnea]|uniref:Uncharacterized protein n=1 Tax=Neoroseomonas eburnea TaxID=1346889 RepID=A0A9X9XKF1_9PROT|nr:hypothetical protein [Neoroseomonas eburnea]MBR0684187.1 hypothetical protein [Neoroseomonas eburnea]
MGTLLNSPFLRTALAADAMASGAMGVALALAPGAIGMITNLPAKLLLGAGLFLLPYAVAVAWMATRAVLPRAMLWVLVAGNLLWALESAALPLLGFVAPNGLGIAFLAVQAAAVAVFAELYIVALRRAGRVA